jgi:hypothetical protein
MEYFALFLFMEVQLQATALDAVPLNNQPPSTLMSAV